MALTLNEFILLVITFSAVVVATVITIFFIQLKKTAKEGESTLREIKELVKSLRTTGQKVNDKLDELGEMIEVTKKTASNISEIAGFVISRVLRPSFKYWPLIFPLLNFGWRQLRKKKGGRDGKR